jgi:hypothetical protein
MAVFKSLNAKQKTYAFDFFDNLKDANPAKVHFKRFPLPGESFMLKGTGSIFSGIDFAKIQKKDDAEMEKLLDSFGTFYIENAQKIDYARFAAECIEGFSDFTFGDKEIKSVSAFFTLDIEPRTIIIADIYKYATTPDTFTTGESPA